LDEIEKKDIEGWLAQIFAEGKAPSTVNKFLSLIQSVYTQAIEWGDVEDHPAKGIKKLTVDNRRLRYLETAEYQQLIKLCR